MRPDVEVVDIKQFAQIANEYKTANAPNEFEFFINHNGQRPSNGRFGAGFKTINSHLQWDCDS